ncbi:MAG: glycosyltransferase family 4 protein [Gemmiger sp.]|nr:glycosyltransferase family 4 protein [Gemmiger sp.]
MRIHLYMGSFDTVKKSGVGQAICHQKAMLQSAGAEVTENWQGHADAVQINTVFPGSVWAALRAHHRGELVVYYGHSTMQDFRNSFVGSNLLAPLFGRWICFCYNLGDVIITPTPYSRKILEGYHLKKPIYALSNGVDTGFFAPNQASRAVFRARYGLLDTDKVVISVGHFMERKGILDFIKLARALPDAQFFWFGYTEPSLVPTKVKNAMLQAPKNLHFPGFLGQADLREAYCGADIFCFCSQEETEGIVVLEALACGVPTVVRDIPVYADWLENGKNVYKASGTAGFVRAVSKMLDGSLPNLSGAGRAVAESRSLPRMGQKLVELYHSRNAPTRFKRRVAQ